MAATATLEQETDAPAQSGQEREMVVKVKGLTKIFKDFWHRPKARAVNDVSFDIRRGEVFGLLGPNGSGKSTTIKMLLGLLHPTSGLIQVFGRSPRDVKTKARIGYLPEESYLYKYLDSEETLDFFGNLFAIGGAERRKRAEQLLEMVGLKGVHLRTVGEFSKGMQRRIGLAQALINDPDLVMLDEPTSGLDPLGTREMKDMIIELKEQGKTVVMCSHLLADVQDVCDRIAILYQGELKEMGRVDELLEVTNQQQIRVEGLTPEAQKQIAEILQNSGGKLMDVSSPKNTLENLFLDIVRESQSRPGARGIIGSGDDNGTR